MNLKLNELTFYRTFLIIPLMSKKFIIALISSLFLITSCATVSEKANNAYDAVAGAVSKGYNKVKSAVTRD